MLKVFGGGGNGFRNTLFIHNTRITSIPFMRMLSSLLVHS